MSGETSAKKMNAVVRDPQHYKRVLLSIQSFNASRSFTDVCFVCARGHKVYAHKLLLSTVSTLLKEIFLDIPDSLQTFNIHLPDVEARKVALIVDFLYEGSVRVNQHEYKDFQGIMDTLGIVLTPPSQAASQTGGSSIQQTVQPIAQHPQQMQAPQLVYMPTTPNSQGQVQYVLATPGQLNQAQVLQAPLMSPVQPTGQVQNGGQVMQVAASQVQQHTGNMMQMVQQNNNHVVSGSQMLSGGQIVQCSSQMVVQGNQQSIVSNNQMQVGMQNQVAQNNYVTNQTVQQQPQYVMTNTNQLTNSRSTTQYSHPRTQGVVRSRPAQIQQPTRISNEDDGEHMSLVESIKSILQENSADPECLTARRIRESLEQRLDRDLAHMEEDIEFVLKSFEAEDDKSVLQSIVSKSYDDKSTLQSIVPTVSGPSVMTTKTPKPSGRPSGSEVKAPKSSVPKTTRRKKMPYFCKSDDETDVDFVPRIQPKKKSPALRKKKKSE